VRRAFHWVLILCVLIAVLAGFHRFWLSALGGYLVHADNAATADIIVVLAGDYAGNRILKAGELVRSGIAPKALVSGPADFYDLHESDLEIPFAVRRGYSESYFEALPNDSKSTASEADVVIPELRRRNVHRVDIVTSNFHTRRAGNIYRAKAGDLEIHIVACPDRYFSPDGWWKNREGRKTFLTEWQKTVGTWLGM
jgi:uncharacterized SAM-binding protein YcdF (DUF218 family)